MTGNVGDTGVPKKIAPSQWQKARPSKCKRQGNPS